MTTPEITAYLAAMQAFGVPHEPLSVYTSNSFRRVGLASQYKEVMGPTICSSDGHPDLYGLQVLAAMVAAFNAMPVTIAMIELMQRELSDTRDAYLNQSARLIAHEAATSPVAARSRLRRRTEKHSWCSAPSAGIATVCIGNRISTVRTSGTSVAG